MTVRTWDELIGSAADVLDAMPGGLPPAEYAEAMLGMLREWGLAIVPREATTRIEDAHFEAHARAETVFAEFPDLWRAMLAAGEIKPEGGGDGLATD